MQAMVLVRPGTPLQAMNVPIPSPKTGEVLIQVEACGVCRTDLHIYDGELKSPTLPLILGHQIIGKIVENGDHAHRFPIGARVGVPWLGKSCEECPYCLSGKENLCDNGRYTGYQFNGGFAAYCVADEKFIFPIPSHLSSIHAAPLLCAGLIGYRSLRLAGNGKYLGFYGFGSAAHILTQVARHQGQEVFAFTRPGDTKTQEFAKKIGAIWSGGSDEKPPVELDAALIFASSGELVPLALNQIKKGGVVVCAGIYMSEIPSFPYASLYGEKILRSVTNLTREDGEQFFDLIGKIKIETIVSSYPLEKVNEAMNDLRLGKVNGSAVIFLEPVQNLFKRV